MTSITLIAAFFSGGSSSSITSNDPNCSDICNGQIDVIAQMAEMAVMAVMALIIS